MKIALHQLNYNIGNFELNTQLIIDAINQSKDNNVDIAVFSELAVSGYPPRDFLEFEDFIVSCYDRIKEIAHHCKGIAAIIGAPSINNSEGKPLFNSAFFITDGEVKHIINKTLLPTYDIFDEYRYFEANTDFSVIKYKNKRIAITICEDIWITDDNKLYKTIPMDELQKQNPDFVINIAASPFSYKQPQIRKEVLTTNAQKYKVPFLYVNHVGAQTELLFDGASMVLNGEGDIVKQCKQFEEDMLVVETDDIDKMSAVIDKPKEKMELIYKGLIMGMRNYFEKLGFTKAILGLSGGIDSALTMAIAAEAIGAENVLGVLLPSQFSSDHSVNDAIALADNLGSPYEIINIESAYKTVKTELDPVFKDLPFGLAEENIQARLRAVYLMAISNKKGHILLNTSNKSEAAVGYGTLYGDMCGGISVIGDVYKTEVFELARYINRNKEIIPVNTITKPPSAELRPDQFDSDSLPDYDILDQILYNYIEERKGPLELEEMGFEKALITRVLNLVNRCEYKRYQTPPILRVSTKAFGMGRRMPIVAKYFFS